MWHASKVDETSLIAYPHMSIWQLLIAHHPHHSIQRNLTQHIHLHRSNLRLPIFRSWYAQPEDHLAISQEKNLAAMATAGANVAGLGTPALSLSRPSKKPSLTSGFIRTPVQAANPLKLAQVSSGKFTCFERDWLRTDLNVIGFGLIGWLAPSSIPAINGNSLTGLFFQSIGAELAHWPTGPPLTSQFWLWLVTWHIGLFLCLTFGQIGFKGRSEGYF